jgi:hypothetical protein
MKELSDDLRKRLDALSREQVIEESIRVAGRIIEIFEDCEENLPKARVRAENAIEGMPMERVFAAATAAWWNGRAQTILELVEFVQSGKASPARPDAKLTGRTT